ncbi:MULTISPECIES: GNAT family N-acetyltransferase [unclassified Nonomuraea]|uniref:GNAT family N-acetyltransferase n=1 Tax=unclassified Nonomuraea TaxID=2593643 RepID=UPI003400233D
MTPLRTARPGDREALHALWAACFDAPHVVPLYETDPGRYGRTFVTGDVSACVYYLPRRVHDGLGGEVLVGGVANVAAHPSVRGRGHVRRLLAMATEAMAADGCAWSLLFTGTPGVYKEWSVFELRTVSGPLRRPAAGGRRLRGLAAGDAALLRDLYDRHNARRPLTAVRDEAHWRDRLPIWYGDPVELLAGDAGYAAVRWEGGVLDVLEVAGDVPEVLSALAAEAEARGVGTGRARLTWDDPALPHLFASVVPERDRTGMARAVLGDPAPVVGAANAAHWPADYF